MDTLDPLLVEFTDNSFYEPTEWAWDFGDGSTGSEVNPLHTFPTTGTYTVCLTVSNQYSSDQLCRQVTVGEVTAAGERGGEGVSVSLYPNPASDKVTLMLQSPLTKSGELWLYDSLGRLVKKYALPAGYAEYRFPVKPLPAGMYFYTLSVEQAVIASGKLVKEE